MTVATASDGIKEITTPLSDADVESLKAGDRVRITGVMTIECHAHRHKETTL